MGMRQLISSETRIRLQGAASSRAYTQETMLDLNANDPAVGVRVWGRRAVKSPPEAEVRLGVSWSRPGANFWESLLAVLRGPMPPKEFDGGQYFRDCWVGSRWPARAVGLALALQVALVLLHPHWNLVTPRPITVEAELTWYAPAQDLPQIPLDLPKKNLDSIADPKQPLPREGADAYHPRQTILSAPLHPTHPRQVLIQPDAPNVAPRILPSLPNIVEWSDSSQTNPRLSISQQAFARMHPEASQPKDTQPVAAPEIADPQLQAGPIDIGETPADHPKPALTIHRMSAGHAQARRTEMDTPAPDVAGNIGGDTGHIIAISATPGPAAPPPVAPKGNLTARVSISPEGTQPGTPGGAAGGAAGATGGPSGGEGNGASGISITGGAPNSHAPIGGIGNGSGHGIGAPGTSAHSMRASPQPAPEATPTPSNFAALGPDARPEILLGPGQVYTLHVNMPNFTSAAGSWILNFAEMDTGGDGPRSAPLGAGLVGPEPVRKVDPRYPPSLRKEKIEGEVILYAVIRKDGSVDSIQLVRGVDPELDNYAMEALSGWKFRPAEREGTPVDLVAIVRIPFRTIAPDR
jgi:TonB family protein